MGIQYTRKVESDGIKLLDSITDAVHRLDKKPYDCEEIDRTDDKLSI